MMKNIAIFTNSLLPGGAEKQALLLAVSLKDEYNVSLIVYHSKQTADKYLRIAAENNIRVEYLNGHPIKKLLYLLRFLKQNKVYIIFSYLLTTNLIGAIAGKLASVPNIVGGIRNARLDKKKLPLQRFINNHLSTYTIYNNFAGVFELQKSGFNVKKAVVIPNCFRLTTQSLTRPCPAVVSIITVGRFVHQKGYFEALKIMRALKDNGVQFNYFIIGYGELEQDLLKEIIVLDLQAEVKIIINPPNLSDYYTRADIYLCTSYFEGLSNTIMEALSFSLPVVATDVGDNNRLVFDGINGFLVSECRYNLFIEPLKTLIRSPDRQRQMGQESYRIIKNQYSSEAFKTNYANFIESLEHQKAG